MKKILKLFGVLIAMSTLLCLSGCDLASLLGGGDSTPEEVAKEYQKVTGDAINHEFYLSDNKGDYSYYTSTTSFTYGNHEDCIYQINFVRKNTPATEGTWKLYTRPRGSTKTIEMVYSGTFKGVNGGSVRTGGTVDLFIDGNKIDTIDIQYKTVQLRSGTTEAYACNLNVAASHAAIGAHDEK